MFQQLSEGQNTTSKKGTVVQEAHYKKLKLDDFSASNNKHFKASVFAIEEALTNKKHHWFLQILTSDNRYVNFGKIDFIKGHLKTDENVKFEFMNPIFSLCNEGKYIIGYVDVNTPGVYKLLIQIDNFGTKDTIEVELTIGENYDS